MKKHIKTLAIAIFVITAVLGSFLMITPQAFAADRSTITNADFIVDSIILPQAIESERAIQAQALALHPMTGFGGPAPAEGSFFGPAPVSGGGFGPPVITNVQVMPKDESGTNDISLYGPPPVDVAQVAQDQRR